MHPGWSPPLGASQARTIDITTDMAPPKKSSQQQGKRVSSNGSLQTPLDQSAAEVSNMPGLPVRDKNKTNKKKNSQLNLIPSSAAVDVSVEVQKDGESIADISPISFADLDESSNSNEIEENNVGTGNDLNRTFDTSEQHDSAADLGLVNNNSMVDRSLMDVNGNNSIYGTPSTVGISSPHFNVNSQSNVIGLSTSTQIGSVNNNDGQLFDLNQHTEVVLNEATGGKKRMLSNSPQSEDDVPLQRPAKEGYALLQSENGILKNKLSELEAKYKQLMNDVHDGTLLSSGTLMSDKLNETKAKLEGALVQLRELQRANSKLNTINKELRKELDQTNEACELIRSDLQLQIDTMKVEIGKLKIENSKLCKELLKAPNTNINTNLNTNSNNLVNDGNTDNLYVETNVNGRVVSSSPTRGADYTLISGRHHQSASNAGVRGDVSSGTDLPQHKQHVTFSRSNSAIDSVTGGFADSVISHGSAASLTERFSNPDSRNKKRANNNSENAQMGSLQASNFNLEATREIICDILHELGLSVPTRKLNSSQGRQEQFNKKPKTRESLTYAQTVNNSQAPARNSRNHTNNSTNPPVNNLRKDNFSNKNLTVNERNFPVINSNQRRRGRQTNVLPNPSLNPPRDYVQTDSSHSKRHIYRPTPDEHGQIVKVALQLQQAGIRSSEFGVKSFQQLPDGSLSVLFDSEENHLKFNEILTNKKLLVVFNQPVPNPFEFRIHRLNAGILTTLVREEIVRQTGISPIEVEIHPYHDQRFKESNFSIVRCNRDLFERVRTLNAISIGWEKYRVDTSPLPMKCKVCGLLGHTSKRCSTLVVPDVVKEKLSIENSAAATSGIPCCADCLYQNHLNKNNKWYVIRPTDHNRLSNECKTYM